VLCTHRIFPLITHVQTNTEENMSFIVNVVGLLKLLMIFHLFGTYHELLGDIDHF